MDEQDSNAAIAAAFRQSWIDMELFFAERIINGNAKWLIPIYRYIFVNRVVGDYPQKLRAGQAMDNFVLSRSHKHGLRAEQPRLVFLAFDDNEIIVTYFDGISTTEITVVTGDDKWLMVDEVKGLLDQMVEHPVD